MVKSIYAFSGLVIATLILSGCATEPPPPPHIFATKYAKQELPKLPSNATNAVVGRAFLYSTAGFGTCAGNTIFLIPSWLDLDYSKSDYEKEVKTLSALELKVAPIDSDYLKFKQDLKAIYLKYSRRTNCSSDGSFRFYGLPSGSYNLISNVNSPPSMVKGEVYIPSDSDNKEYSALVNSKPAPFEVSAILQGIDP